MKETLSLAPLEKLSKAVESGKIGKIFGWIGAVLGVIGALIATVATGGAAAPALAIALVGLTMMILQETGAMDKIVEYLAENPEMLMIVLGPVIGGLLFTLIEQGVIPEDRVKMAIQLTFAAAMLVASIAGMIATGGASATDAIFKIIGMVGQVLGALSSIGSGVAGIMQSKYSYDSANIQADIKENQAWLQKMKAMLEEEIERLEKIIEQLNGNAKEASDALDGIAKSHQSIISHMGA